MLQPSGAAADRSADPWFWSHFDDAALVMMDLVPAEVLAEGRSVLDFGCGDGAMALGVASRCAAAVTGVDLYRSFDHLPGMARANLGLDRLPPNLRFVEVRAGEPMPLAPGCMDLVYSWSVFEHVADPPAALADIHRVSKAGAILFIQIEPLYYSPFGSHLQRLVPEPWAHLLLGEDEFLRRAAAAEDHIDASEHDVLYRMNAFAEVKRHLIGEYRTLNRITAERLVELVVAAGFGIESQLPLKVEGLSPPERLLRDYPPELLLTNQVVLVAHKLAS